MTGTPPLNGVRRSLFQKYKCANSTFTFLSCGTHDIAAHIDYRYHEAIAEMIVCVYNLSERSGGNITKCALILNLRLSVRSPSGLADGYRKIEKCYSHFLFHAASTSTIFAIRKYLFLYLLDFLTVRKSI